MTGWETQPYEVGISIRRKKSEDCYLILLTGVHGCQFSDFDCILAIAGINMPPLQGWILLSNAFL